MPDTTAPARHANGRFGPGNPGRRAGARGKVSHQAAMAILEDFDLHREQVLSTLRRNYAPAYFAILTRLLERQLQIDTPMADDLSDIEVAQTVALARRAISLNENPRSALIELESALSVAPSPDAAASARRINGD